MSKDVTEREEACKTLLSLSESVAARLRKAGQLAGMVSVEIKYSNFRSVSHQTMLYSPSDTSRIIYDTACRLFDELWDHSPIRLLGVRTSKLVSATEPIQLSLFDLNAVAGNEKEPASEKLAALDKALDDIRNKFGNDAVVRGSLLSPKGKDASHRSP